MNEQLVDKQELLLSEKLFDLSDLFRLLDLNLEDRLALIRITLKGHEWEQKALPGLICEYKLDKDQSWRLVWMMAHFNRAAYKMYGKEYEQIIARYTEVTGGMFSNCLKALDTFGPRL